MKNWLTFGDNFWEGAPSLCDMEELKRMQVSLEGTIGSKVSNYFGSVDKSISKNFKWIDLSNAPRTEVHKSLLMEELRKRRITPTMGTNEIL